MSLLLALVLMVSAQPRGVVVNPVANMYSAPTEESDVVSQAIYGTNVVMEEEKQRRRQLSGGLPERNPGHPPRRMTRVEEALRQLSG